MQLWKIALMANEVLIAADAPTTQHITVEDLYEHMRREDLLTWLAHDIEPKVDFSHFSLTEQDKAEILEYLYSMYSAYGGDHYRKWGIQNQGLHLLAVWLNEAIIQRSRKDRIEYDLRAR